MSQSTNDEQGRPTCMDLHYFSNLPNGRWPWYVRLALLLRPAIVAMDDEGIFGFRYKRMFGRTYIVGQISNYVTPAEYR